MAGLAVGIGVPILLFYVYGVVPVSLCRAGGCGGGAGARGGEGDAHSMPPSVDEVPERRQEPSIGEDGFLLLLVMKVGADSFFVNLQRLPIDGGTHAPY